MSCSHVCQVVTYGVYRLSSQEIHKVIAEIGLEHIVQIVTDNGSNYKKACQMIIKFSIVWQPCLAHTINLMLKAVGEFPEHKAVILAGRIICWWLYNHNKLHAIMMATMIEPPQK
jgi:hypothetical protein